MRHAALVTRAASADARTFASLLNASGLLWYNLSQRASVCLQERLACELYGPPELAALAWVSGVNNLISLIVGEGEWRLK